MAVDVLQSARPGPATAGPAVGAWLALVAVLVFAMVILGGVTRLTESGLSMVEWRPVTGWLPPLGQAEWQAEFDKYRQFPEYQKVNRGMELAAFKRIYWFEYAHRLLGRLIGLAYALPLFAFLAAGRIPRPMVPPLGGLLLLGGAQGALGWFMVQSGLVDRPDVSHYRLAAHLGLAVVILGALSWVALGQLFPAGRPAAPSGLRRLAGGVLALVFLQILSGGLVAGLNAGLVYNTWPLFDGHLLPPDLLAGRPWWLNPLENVAMVQFGHRMLAYGIVATTLLLWVRLRAEAARLGRRARLCGNVLLAVVPLQALLGVLTLLHAVPVGLAALHQAVGLCVFLSALALLQALRSEGPDR